MGIFTPIVNWLERRKEEKPDQGANPFDKRRNELDITDMRCQHCNHDKAWIKDGYLKCTKCGNKTYDDDAGMA